jgi:hypothetical protein
VSDEILYEGAACAAMMPAVNRTSRHHRLLSRVREYLDVLGGRREAMGSVLVGARSSRPDSLTRVLSNVHVYVFVLERLVDHETSHVATLGEARARYDEAMTELSEVVRRDGDHGSAALAAYRMAAHFYVEALRDRLSVGLPLPSPEVLRVLRARYDEALVLVGENVPGPARR